ncbi:uncharacterized protein LOC129766163 [Toxorhynchites rutilus septentrionalis]|uniref:uncharacterized protein LOC129766163 n=1 Tax=Toxorhynchites rutilus septentrionalis TaxID=329112 RepID=UPI002479FC5B|nr:uncharacterized protein LOC129766163 [Toxorhynchites rutilus septentrionalis]
MANRLGVPKKRANVPITGINALRSLAREKVNISFRSRVSSFRAGLDCLVTKQATGTIPTSNLDIDSWNIPTGLILADPQFHIPAKIDMLIGAEIFFDIFKPSQLLLEDHLPHLRDTYLGWIVSDVIHEPYSPTVNLQHSNIASIEEVETMMQQFWQIEKVSDVPKFSAEE